ncbi:MAG: sugar ABC transporter permease [Clostridiales Family XIII bacterium]|jgi:putative spermidine/putrescine transport system permease protein|nr:sugar ABC transporter permease [Clostridiales Family XIII bacterium]
MKGRLSLALSFLPIAVLMGVAYVWPVIAVVWGSLSGDDGRFAGWRNYSEVLNSYYFWDSLLFTFRVSLVSTAVSVALAIALAMALRDSFPGKRLALFVSQYNLSIPRLAAAMIMVFLLSQTGFLSSLARQAGLTESIGDFPWLVYDSRGIGLMAVFVWKFVPYIGLSVLGILQGASAEYEQQAATLGVGMLGRFFHVILPTVVPAVAVSSILVFASSFGDYEVPAILGSPQRRSVSVMLYLKYVDPDMKDPPEAFAMMALTSLALMAAILTYRRLAASDARKRGL